MTGPIAPEGPPIGQKPSSPDRGVAKSQLTKTAIREEATSAVQLQKKLSKDETRRLQERVREIKGEKKHWWEKATVHTSVNLLNKETREVWRGRMTRIAEFSRRRWYNITTSSRIEARVRQIEDSHKQEDSYLLGELIYAQEAAKNHRNTHIREEAQKKVDDIKAKLKASEDVRKALTSRAQEQLNAEKAEDAPALDLALLHQSLVHEMIDPNEQKPDISVDLIRNKLGEKAEGVENMLTNAGIELKDFVEYIKAEAQAAGPHTDALKAIDDYQKTHGDVLIGRAARSAMALQPQNHLAAWLYSVPLLRNTHVAGFFSKGTDLLMAGGRNARLLLGATTAIAAAGALVGVTLPVSAPVLLATGIATGVGFGLKFIHHMRWKGAENVAQATEAVAHGATIKSKDQVIGRAANLREGVKKAFKGKGVRGRANAMFSEMASNKQNRIIAKVLSHIQDEGVLLNGAENAPIQKKEDPLTNTQRKSVDNLIAGLGEGKNIDEALSRLAELRVRRKRYEETGEVYISGQAKANVREKLVQAEDKLETKLREKLGNDYEGRLSDAKSKWETRLDQSLHTDKIVSLKMRFNDAVVNGATTLAASVIIGAGVGTVVGEGARLVSETAQHGIAGGISAVENAPGNMANAFVGSIEANPLVQMGARGVSALDQAISTHLPGYEPPTTSIYYTTNTTPDGTTGYTGVHGGGGVHCFLPGTQISTPKGMVSIEDLRQGDVVISFDEATKQPFDFAQGKKSVSVIGEIGKFTQESYFVINGTIRVTGHHQFYIYPSSRHPELDSGSHKSAQEIPGSHKGTNFLQSVAARNDEWLLKEAQNLKPGDLLVSELGKPVSLEKIEKVSEPTAVFHLFNLTPNSNFYAEGILVHNSNVKEGAAIGQLFNPESSSPPTGFSATTEITLPNGQGIPAPAGTYADMHGDYWVPTGHGGFYLVEHVTAGPNGVTAIVDGQPEIISNNPIVPAQTETFHNWVTGHSANNINTVVHITPEQYQFTASVENGHIVLHIPPGLEPPQQGAMMFNVQQPDGIHHILVKTDANGDINFGKGSYEVWDQSTQPPGFHYMDASQLSKMLEDQTQIGHHFGNLANGTFVTTDTPNANNVFAFQGTIQAGTVVEHGGQITFNDYATIHAGGVEHAGNIVIGSPQTQTNINVEITSPLPNGEQLAYLPNSNQIIEIPSGTTIYIDANGNEFLVPQDFNPAIPGTVPYGEFVKENGIVVIHGLNNTGGFDGNQAIVLQPANLALDGHPITQVSSNDVNNLLNHTEGKIVAPPPPPGPGSEPVIPGKGPLQGLGNAVIRTIFNDAGRTMSFAGDHKIGAALIVGGEFLAGGAFRNVVDRRVTIAGNFARRSSKAVIGLGGAAGTAEGLHVLVSSPYMLAAAPFIAGYLIGRRPAGTVTGLGAELIDRVRGMRKPPPGGSGPTGAKVSVNKVGTTVGAGTTALALSADDIDVQKALTPGGILKKKLNNTARTINYAEIARAAHVPDLETDITNQDAFARFAHELAVDGVKPADIEKKLKKLSDAGELDKDHVQEALITLHRETLAKKFATGAGKTGFLAQIGIARGKKKEEEAVQEYLAGIFEEQDTDLKIVRQILDNDLATRKLTTDDQRQQAMRGLIGFGGILDTSIGLNHMVDAMGVTATGTSDAEYLQKIGEVMGPPNNLKAKIVRELVNNKVQSLGGITAGDEDQAAAEVWGEVEANLIANKAKPDMERIWTLNRGQLEANGGKLRSGLAEAIGSLDDKDAIIQRLIQDKVQATDLQRALGATPNLEELELPIMQGALNNANMSSEQLRRLAVDRAGVNAAAAATMNDQALVDEISRKLHSATPPVKALTLRTALERARAKAQPLREKTRASEVERQLDIPKIADEIQGLDTGELAKLAAGFGSNVPATKEGIAEAAVEENLDSADIAGAMAGTASADRILNQLRNKRMTNALEHTAEINSTSSQTELDNLGAEFGKAATPVAMSDLVAEMITRGLSPTQVFEAAKKAHTAAQKRATGPTTVPATAAEFMDAIKDNYLTAVIQTKLSSDDVLKRVKDELNIPDSADNDEVRSQIKDKLRGVKVNDLWTELGKGNPEDKIKELQFDAILARTLPPKVDIDKLAEAAEIKVTAAGTPEEKRKEIADILAVEGFNPDQTEQVLKRIVTAAKNDNKVSAENSGKEIRKARMAERISTALEAKTMDVPAAALIAAALGAATTPEGIADKAVDADLKIEDIEKVIKLPVGDITKGVYGVRIYRSLGKNITRLSIANIDAFASSIGLPGTGYNQETLAAEITEKLPHREALVAPLVTMLNAARTSADAEAALKKMLTP